MKLKYNFNSKTFEDAKRLRWKSLSGIFTFMIAMFSQFNAFAGNLTVNVNSSSGGSLPNAATFQVFKGPNYVGSFAAGSTISLTTGATYTLFALYDNTTTSRQTFVSDAGGDVYNFRTTSVTFHFSGGYLEYRGAGSWSSFGKTSGVWNTRELFPKDFYGNTMSFHTGYVWNDVRGYDFTIDYEGKTSIEKTIAILRVLNSDNAPIAGVTFRGGYTSPTVWHVPGSTNSAGLLADIRDGNQTTLSYEAKVNNTIAVVGPQDPNSNAYYLFKTIKVTLKLQTCASAPLAGGTARYGIGASYSSYFYPSPNSTDANGETSAEFFPGTYSFEMNYQSTSQVKSSVTIPNANTTLTWTTTNVTLSWPYDISYGGSGDSRYFNKPSMELLAGNVNFNFRGAGNNYVTLAISGCSMSYKSVVVRLITSTGAPIAGGLAKYYVSGWNNIGTTDANGRVVMLFNSSVNNAYFNMTYANATQQVGSLNINTNPVVTFQTANVKLELKNSSGNYYDTEGMNVGYYSNGWYAFGSGQTASGVCTMELLPVNYYFRMSVFNQTQQKGSINIASLGANPTITFQTVAVTLKLNNAAGNGTHEASGLKYYTNGWYDFADGNTNGDGTETMELLPGNYYFRMTYANQTQQKGSMSISSSQTVDFQTVEVTLRLLGSNGNCTREATNLGYYSNGWYTFGSGSTTGSGTETMELLPGNYYFRLSYANQSQQKGSMSISSSQTVDFQTLDVTLKLNNAAGNGTLEANGLKYYSNGWYTFGSGETNGSGTETMELLPGNYYFKMCYANQSQQKGSMNINASQTIDFQTIVVTQHIDDGSNGLSGASAQYYSNGWYSFGTTDANGDVSKELLPGNYYFKMTYNSSTKQKGSYSITSNTTVNYTYSGGSVSRMIVFDPKKDNILKASMDNASADMEDAQLEEPKKEEVILDNSTSGISKVIQNLGVAPNPAISSTVLTYSLTQDAQVVVKIYNSLGQEVATVLDVNQGAGTYSTDVDLTEFASGIYYIKVYSAGGMMQLPIMINR